MITDFSAREPSLGYYYQVRFGLLTLLKAIRELDNPTLKLEALDDIQLDDLNQTHLIQTKLHVLNPANLTDRSGDFWKTIRVWAESIKSGELDLESSKFTLVTTERIPENSILINFKPDSKKVESLQNDLCEIAKEKDNKNNLKGYESFLSLTDEQRKQLLSKIVIADSSLDIEEVRKRTFKELMLSTLPEKVESLFERLEGWWIGQCILNLSKQIEFISGIDLHRQLVSIADSLTVENLPLDFPVAIEFSDDAVENENTRTFVQQLKIIGIKGKVLRSSISDYYRAFNQRAKWIREDLLNPNEENIFEAKLLDDWKSKHDLLCDSSESSMPHEKEKEGNRFFTVFYVETTPRIYFRPKFQERYLTVGSCHMLSDRKKIGWHPDFETLI